MTVTARQKGDLSATFARHARRALLTGLLALTTLTANRFGTTRPDTTAKPAAPVETVTAADTPQHVFAKPDIKTAVLTDDVKKEINSMLVYNAQLNYYDLAQGADNGYSRFLDSLETELNGFLKRTDTSIHSQIVIIDPIKSADIPMALGIGQYMSVKDDILTDSITDMPEKILRMAVSNIARNYTTAYGQTHYTQMPATFYDPYNKNPTPVVIVPMAYDAHQTDLAIAGFSHHERVRLVTMHEAWHAIDHRYHLRDTPVDTQSVNLSNPAAMAANPQALSFISIMHKREAFADIATLGEMAFRGSGTDVISRLSAVRAARTDDVVHQTAPALDGLLAELSGAKLGAFRNMNEQQRIDFYYSVTEKYAMQAHDFKIMYRYQAADSTGRGQIIRDTASGKAMRFHHLMQKDGGGDNATSPQTAQALEKWDALGDMIRRAFGDSGVVTPETVIGAFARMQDGLWRQSIADPGNDLYPEKMTKLKKTLYENLTTLDYAGINKSMGVKTDKILRLHKTPATGK